MNHIKKLTLFVFLLAALAGCKKAAQPPAGIELDVRLADTFNVGLIKAVRLVVDQSPFGRSLKLDIGTRGGGTVNGRPYTSEVKDLDGDGEGEYAILIEGNPFSSRRFAFDLISPGYASVPFKVRAAIIGQNGVIGTMERNHDELGDTLRFEAGRRRSMLVYVPCTPRLSCLTTTNAKPHILTPETVGLAAGATLSFTVATDDPDGDPVAVTADMSGLPASHGAKFTATEKRFQWKPSNAHLGGPYMVHFDADDGHGGTARSTLSVTVLPPDVNSPPLFAPLAEQVAHEGEVLNFTVQVTDPDGDVYTLKANLDELPPSANAVFDGTTGRFFWVPSRQSARELPFLVTFTAEDERGGKAELKLPIRVFESNQAPLFAPLGSGAVNISAQSPLSVSVLSTDGDNDPLTYSADLTALPAGHGATFEAATKLFKWTPTAAMVGGPYTVIFKADDGKGGVGATQLAITVLAPSANSLPQFDPLTHRELYEEENIQAQVMASDADVQDTALTYSADLSGLPANHGASFNEGTRTFTWKPARGTARFEAYSVIFKANDGRGGIGTLEWRLKVKANVAPRLHELTPQSLEEGTVKTVAIKASDADPLQTLTFCLASGPSWAEVTGSGPSPGPVDGTIKLSPGQDAAGAYALVVRVFDGGTCQNPHAYAERALAVTVSGTNAAPTLEPVADQTVLEGAIHDVALSASDQDSGQVLRFCKLSGPSWTTVAGEGLGPGPVAGNLRLAPGSADVGSYTVVVRAIDGGSCQSPMAFAEASVAVTVTGTNTPPIIASPGAVSVGEDTIKELAFTASDPDPGQTVSFCKVSGPEWATVSGSGATPGTISGTLRLQPGPNDRGDYLIILRAIDGGNCNDPGGAAVVPVTVFQTNTAPVMAALGPKIMEVHDTERWYFPITDADDADEGQTITVCKAAGPDWAEVRESSPHKGTSITGELLAATEQGGTVGDHYVTIRAFNHGSCNEPTGGYSEQTVKITLTGQTGMSCNESRLCSSGHCTDGVCCKEACDKPCHACNLTGRGQMLGHCNPMRGGEDPPHCSGTASCSDSGFCLAPVTSGASQAESPDLAWTGSEFAVTWLDHRDGNYENYFARVATSGQRIGDAVRLTHNATGPLESPSTVLTWTGSGFSQLWEEARSPLQLYFRNYSPTGQTVNQEAALTSMAGDARNAALIWTGSEYGLAWEYKETQGFDAAIFFARVTGAGALIGTPTRVSSPPQQMDTYYQPALAWTGSEYGLAWFHSGMDGPELRFSRVTSAGERVGAIENVDFGWGIMDPSLVWTGSGYGLVWRRDQGQGQYNITFSKLDTLGMRLQGGYDIRGPYGRPRLAWAGSEFGLLYTRAEQGLLFRRLDSDGYPMYTNYTITDQGYMPVNPRLIWTGSEYGATWTDQKSGSPQIYMTRFPNILFEEDS